MRAGIADWSNPDYTEVWAERTARLNGLRDERTNVDAVKAYYREHPVEWIEDWAFTYDPRADKSPFVPFILFPKQRELILWLWGRFKANKPGVIEKSRDTGISWVLAAFLTWVWLFLDAKVAIGSYDAEHVDVLGNMDSIMEKVRSIIRYCPDEFLPYENQEHLEKSLMHKRCTRPDSVSTITGEIGKNIGRGGRNKMYFVDEAAHLQHPDLADASLSATAECKIWGSTPFGLGNFYNKVTSGTFDVFRFHYTDDPRKTPEWAAQKRKEIGATKWAQEYDLDHGASVENQLVESTWCHASRQILAAYEAKGIEVPDRSKFKRGVSGLDVGGDGPSKTVLTPRFGPYVLDPVDWDEGDTTVTAHKALRYAKKFGTARLNFDANSIGAGVASTLRHSKGTSLPPTVVQKMPTISDDPIVQLLIEQGEMTSDDLLPEEVEGERIVARGIMVGKPASTWVKWPDGLFSNEKFLNLRAEIYWTIRVRLQKTHECWLWLTDQEGGEYHPFDELLILPDCDKLVTELCSLTYYETNTGKTAIESKKDLAARGVASPDFSDSLSFTLVPTKAGIKVSKVEGYY